MVSFRKLVYFMLLAILNFWAYGQKPTKKEAIDFLIKYSSYFENTLSDDRNTITFSEIIFKEEGIIGYKTWENGVTCSYRFVIDFDNVPTRDCVKETITVADFSNLIGVSYSGEPEPETDDSVKPTSIAPAFSASIYGNYKEKYITLVFHRKKVTSEEILKRNGVAIEYDGPNDENSPKYHQIIRLPVNNDEMRERLANAFKRLVEIAKENSNDRF